MSRHDGLVQVHQQNLEALRQATAQLTAVRAIINELVVTAQECDEMTCQIVAEIQSDGGEMTASAYCHVYERIILALT